MLKLNMSQFVEDVRSGRIEDSKVHNDFENGYNLTNYIYNKQPNTKLWHYVNKDVYIYVDKDFSDFYIEDYGNGVPNWVYDCIKDMLKAVSPVNA